uniref:Uncharacterized protein n=1 Tax=viral metagenome TaxID=1070528 RepID=A0A6C0KT48_9ZZZZ
MTLHYDPLITTLSKALKTLYSIPQTRIVYQQTIDLQHITDYSEYISYFPDHGTVHITFPPQCDIIAKIKNNNNEKMVYYEKKDGFLREIRIKPDSVIVAKPDTKIIVYHTKGNDLVISFCMYLTKFSSKL